MLILRIRANGNIIMRLGSEVVRKSVRGKYIFRDRRVWKICDVQPFLLLPTLLDLRLLFRKLFMVGPYLLSPLDASSFYEFRPFALGDHVLIISPRPFMVIPTFAISP